GPVVWHWRGAQRLADQRRCRELFAAGEDRTGTKTKARPKFVIPSDVEGSRGETFEVTSAGFLDSASLSLEMTARRVLFAAKTWSDICRRRRLCETRSSGVDGSHDP